MRYRDFSELKGRVVQAGRKCACAVVAAEDPHTLEAAMRARADGLIEPVLIGDVAVIRRYLDEHGYGGFDGWVRDAADVGDALELAIAMVHAGDAQCMMKGLVRTDQFMAAVLKRESGLRTGKLVSMLSFRELPNYHKLLAFTDTGIIPHPTLEQKKQIIENAASAMANMGIDTPKVAVLAATEEPNPRMPESMEAAELKRMNQNGDIGGCVVEGPISLDLALSPEAAASKGYASPVAGDADLLLFPDLACANITAKMIAHITGAPAGVLILGTKVPVIVSSRSASVDTKYLSITLAVATAPPAA
jgi:phosphate butyryltransferase